MYKNKQITSNPHMGFNFFPFHVTQFLKFSLISHRILLKFRRHLHHPPFCDLHVVNILSLWLGNIVDSGIGLSHRPASLCSLVCRYDNPTVPEITDPVFAKTSQNARFLFSENERFGLVFVKTGSINSGTALFSWVQEESKKGNCRIKNSTFIDSTVSTPNSS
jgi:hypothetical protein